MDDFANFEKTLTQLKEFSALPVENKRDKAGIIQAFEFTFEQCWKALQKRAGSEGIEVASPKKAFMFAFANSWIPKSQEEIWLKMLKDRNLTSHTYHEDIANEVLARISQDYILAFESVLKFLKAPSV